ncbi:MAG: preprotein translocase subunit SecY [Christensenellaceae bacterium]|jgi:preprotein translocase subunit SecY|nr:preprotein translocase subunit SecY [Christensenellaceae bacterium]
MFKTIINAWHIKDIRTKMLFTLLLIMVYRFGSFIPVPFVDATKIAEAAGQYDILNFLNLLSGGSFGQFTIFAMGISPYITGSIVIQLLTIAIPSLERLSKEEDGRQKLEEITRYTGIGLALIQSVGIVIGLGSDVVISTAWYVYVTIGIVCTAGTAFLVWMGERITEKGIGNGISIVIFASICSQVPRVFISIFRGVFISSTYRWWIIPALIVIALAIIALVVLVDRAVRRIPVQYAKRVVGRKMYGGQATHIPLKANANGVMPLIFAVTLMQVPGMIGQFWPNGSFYQFYLKYLSAGTPVYYVIYALLIVGFAYFYSAITFNPVEISKNLQQNGGFIPGIRPGKPTGDYLAKICNRLTLFGAFFLMLLAIFPALFMNGFGMNSMFGPTSVLILVNVALETSEQLESLMLMRHYKGFLG